jgi:tetratricopeptide (TPR) repeat protein
VTENLLRLYLYTDRRQQALQLIQRSFESGSLHRSQALATVVRSDIQGARRRLGDGDPEGAESQLLAAEAVIEGAAGESGLREQIATLRAGIVEQRSTDRFNRATTLYNDGNVEGAREILVELQRVVPEGWHSDAVAGFLERIDDPDAGSAVEAPEPLLSEASPGEIDRLNELIARDEFERALELLEDLEQRVDRSDGSWIDLKIRELRAVLSYNQFVAAYNRAVDQFNGGAYSTAIETLERLLEQQPHAADADAARKLLAEARTALQQQ